MLLQNKKDDMLVHTLQMSCKMLAYTTMERKLYAKTAVSFPI